MKKFQTLTSFLLFTIYCLLPIPAFAVLDGTRDLITAVGGLVSQIIVIVGSIALLVFLWGLVKFIFKSGDEKAHEAGITLMKWGIVALFVMVSIWGIIGFMQRALGLPVTPISNTNTAGEPAGDLGDPCVDAFGNPTYVGDCGTY